MKRISRLVTTIMMVLLLTALSSYAKLGIGLHYGMDFSLKMKDVRDQFLFDNQTVISPVNFVNSIPSNLVSQLPITLDSLKQLVNANQQNFVANTPFKFSRTNFKRSMINFGGKLYVDIIPIIDAIELSFNIGAWQYDAVLRYPDGTLQPNLDYTKIDAFIKSGDYEKVFQMKDFPITLESLGMSYLKMFGITKTPYMKMLFDLSIRKNLFAIPKPLKTWKLYIGGGPSLHIGTPVMTDEFVESTLRDAITNAGSDITNIKSLLPPASNVLLRDMLQKLIDQAKKPTFGIHIILGTMIKLPVIPLGFYVDGKYEIPFGDLDKKAGLKGYGFLLNGGIALAL